jgi:hypothetical protein
MIIYLIFICIFIFAVFSELKDIGCSRVNNCRFLEESPLIKNYLSDKSDPLNLVIDKIKNGLSYNDKMIFWRLNFIGASISFFLLWFLIFNSIPSERNLIIGVLIIFLVFYFMSTFYYYHVENRIKENLLQNIDNLSKYFIEK